MARKDRAPNPPKRPQAPQRRSTPSGPRDGRQRRLLYIVAATGLVALAIVLGVVFLAGGGGDKDLASAMEAGGCQLKTVQAQVGNHTAAEAATSNPKWNTDPPTSGPHYEIPAVYGEYDTPLKPAQFVHNLEHGGRLRPLRAQGAGGDRRSNCATSTTRTPPGCCSRRYPKLGDKVALGAWTVPDDFEPGGTNGTAYLATCTNFDEDAFSTFRDELRFRGPERFPPDSLQPGHS